MTNAIEQSKREMYRLLEQAARTINYKCNPGDVRQFDDFKSSLEAYLEAMRKAMIQTNESTVACAQHSAESFLGLEGRVETLTAELEALHETARKRFEDIQGLETVNAELMEKLSLMTTDRDSLRNRMQAYEARESQASTSGQTSGDRISCATLDGKTAAILGAVVDARQILADWAIYGYGAKKQMKKLAYAINNNPELHAAMLHFEQGDAYATWFLNSIPCMHSFHPVFPRGEQCVFCGVGK